MILPSCAFRGTRRASGDGDVRSSPRVRPSVSVRSLSSILVVVGYEWVRDDMLKCKSCLT